MATVGEVYRQIEVCIHERMLDFVGGAWMDDEQSAEWHGMQAKGYIGHLEGLKDALKVIEQLQKND